MYSCYSSSVRSLQFCPFLCPSLHEMFPWYLQYFEEISSLSYSIFSSVSLYCSLKKAFLSLLANLWNSAFCWLYISLSPLLFTCLLFSAIYKVSSDNHFVLLHFFFLGVVLVAISLKNLPEVQETRVQSLHSEDPLEEAMAATSSILVWRIPWTEEPGRLQSMGGKEGVGHY